MKSIGSRSARSLSFALALVAFAAIHGRAAATVGSYVRMAQLVHMSEVIVRGTVLGGEAAWDEGHHRIYTRTAVRVSHWFKGSGASEIVVRTVGGHVGDVVAGISGMPTFTPGEDVILFLHPGSDYFYAAALSQGVFHVRSTASGATASRDLSGITFVGEGADAASSETSVRVDDLEAQIASLVAGAP
jgi:hypothetical protein